MREFLEGLFDALKYVLQLRPRRVSASCSKQRNNGPELNAIADFRSSLPVVLDVLRNSPISILIFVVLSIAIVVLRDVSPVATALYCMQLAILVRIMYKVVHKVGGECPSSNQNLDTKSIQAVPQLLVLNVEYFLVSYLLMRLLVIPGAIWSVYTSLAINYVCLDNKNSISALKASAVLLKGKFWLAFKYLFPVGVAYNVLLVVVVEIAERVYLDVVATNTSISSALSLLLLVSLRIMVDLILYFLLLWILPLQTKLFLHLTGRSALTVQASVRSRA